MKENTSFWQCFTSYITLLLLLSLTVISHICAEEHKDVALRESIVLISTIDGKLHAVGARTGAPKWSIHDQPILTLVSNKNLSEETKHLLLPDPKDGSLYVFNGFNNAKKHKTLEKLPFTISELVQISPCHSSDGMLYTSKKIDQWVVIDTVTGERLDTVTEKPVCETKQSPEEASIPKAFSSTSNLLHLFKTEYQITVFNSITREKLFNLTFMDYSPSIVSSATPNNYDLLHLTSSANGKMVTIDKSSGEKKFLWSHDFSSPIVSIYRVADGSQFPTLQRVPFLTLGGFINVTTFFQQSSLQPSVYIGEMSQSKSLYALSALVEYNEIRKDSNYLIEGPEKTDLNNVNKPPIGHYDFPTKPTDISFWQMKKSQLIQSMFEFDRKPFSVGNLVGDFDKISDNTSEKILDKFENYTQTMHNLFIASSAILGLAFVILFSVGYRTFFAPRGSAGAGGEDKKKDGKVKIGKIAYNQSDIIGRGCAGTCVYRGKFEGRQEIAVKRIVNDCFKIANREIEMLRKLQHPNLIRYFATESDEQFLHIALELAEMTLAEYVERKAGMQEEMVSLSFEHSHILHQACLGLAHLHSLDVVHRDIKPQNILISLPQTPNKSRKIMISDFGVSKVLNSEHSLTTDFSAGTEGWIAPEILKSKLNGISEKASKPNDIFSMGCLIYYTFTAGDHPFGNLLHRQSKIISGDSDLTAVQKEDLMSLWSLVDAMIQLDPLKRPSIDSVLKHPLFWNSKQSLQFLQDISDRLESEKALDSSIISTLEYGGIDVCQGDWRRHISIELQEDLRKFRSYKGSSVRDLLRAIRNKRHHYHELGPELQNSLGSIPDQFANYFTSKFPRLIPHSYISLQCCRHEDIFQSYYNTSDEYQFKILPKSGVYWYAKLKEDGGKPKEFAFDRRAMAAKNKQEQNGATPTANGGPKAKLSDEPPPLPNYRGSPAHKSAIKPSSTVSEAISFASALTGNHPADSTKCDPPAGAGGDSDDCPPADDHDNDHIKSD